MKTKKKVFTRNGTLFFPELRCRPKKKKKVFSGDGTPFLSTDVRSDAHQSQIIGGDTDEDHTQIFEGYTVKLLGGIYLPHPPLVSAPLLPYQFHTRFCALYLQKSTYPCRVLLSNIVMEVFNFNSYAYYLSTNRGIWLLILRKQGTYCIIARTLQHAALML